MACSMPHLNSVPQSQWGAFSMGSTVLRGSGLVRGVVHRRERSGPSFGSFQDSWGERSLGTDDQRSFPRGKCCIKSAPL